MVWPVESSAGPQSKPITSYKLLNNKHSPLRELLFPSLVSLALATVNWLLLRVLSCGFWIQAHRTELISFRGERCRTRHWVSLVARLCALISRGAEAVRIKRRKNETDTEK